VKTKIDDRALGRMRFLKSTIIGITLATTSLVVAAELKEADIIVYSGMPCGIAASISATRGGAKVILVEPTRHVGGLSTSGLNTAETEHMLKWTIGGFADEFYHQLGKHYGREKPAYNFESSVAEKVYLDMLKEGDAHPAPMNYNFRLTVTRDSRLLVPFPAPKHYDADRYALLRNWLEEQVAQNEPVTLKRFLDFYGRRNGKFELNNKQSAIFSLGHFGGQFDWPDASYEEREKIFEDHMEYTLGLFHFLANDDSVPANVKEEMKAVGLHKGEFADNGHLPYQLYVREARRMRGEYVVRQQDVQTDRRKPDGIGISSHFIDCHHVQRVALNENEFVNEGRIWRIGYAYQIPYRSIIPKPTECTNLLVPGAASFTHVAYCTLRLESVWMITGHAAGVAATITAMNDTDVQKINIPLLQDKLRAQKQVIDFLPGKPEKCEDLNGPPEF